MHERPANPISQKLPAKRSGTGDRSTVAALLLVLTLAAGLRLYQLGAPDYWLDEIHTMTNAAGRRADFEDLPHDVILLTVPRFTDLTAQSTLSAAWHGMQADSHPPVFFVSFLSWRRALGDGEFTARLPAVVFSVLSILAVALSAGAYGRLRDGVWIALALALTYSHLHMSQQARPYALGLMFVSLSYWSFVKMEAGWSGPGWRRKLFWGTLCGIAAYLAVLTHYFTGFALLGQAVVVATSKKRTLTAAWAVLMAAVVGAFVLTWGRQVIAQLDFVESHTWLLEQRVDHGLRTLLRLTDLPVRLLFAHAEFRFNYAYSVIGSVLVIGSGLLLWRRRCRLAIVFAAWYFTPLLVFAAIDLITEKQVLSHVRYVSVAAPGLVGMLVLATLHLRGLWRWVFLTSFGAAVVLTLRLPTQDNPHSRLAASLIARRLTPDSLLVYDAIDWPPFWVSQIYHNVSYYLPEFLDESPPPCLLLRSRPTPEVAAQMACYGRIVVVSPRVGEIPNPVPGRYVSVDRTPYVHQIGFIYVFIESPGER